MPALRFVKPVGDELLFECVFCGADEHLSINRNKGAWQCWKCGERGGVRKLLAELDLDMDIEEFKTYLGVTEQVEEKVGHADKAKIRSVFHEDCLPLPNDDPETDPAMYYLVHRRGLTLADIAKHRIHYGIRGRMKNRVVVPVFDPRTKATLYPSIHNVVFFQGRILDNHTIDLYDLEVDEEQLGRKYQFPSRASWGRKSDWLYGAFRATGEETVYVMEGTLDAMRVGVGAVATFGKKISTAQCSILKRLAGSGTRRLVLAFDQDAFKDSVKTAKALRSYFDQVIYLDMGKEDPADMGRDKFLEFVRSSSAKDVDNFHALTVSLLRKD